MESYVGDIIKKCSNELSKETTKQMISDKIVDPAVREIKGKLWQHYTLFVVLQIVSVILLLFIIIKK